jgi:hypothetical protein
MPIFVLCHRHAPAECAIAAASWRGFDSPLRRRQTLSSCLYGGHRLSWTVQAQDAAAALAFVPPFVAERTRVEEVREVRLP